MATPAAQSSVCTEAMNAIPARTMRTAMVRTVWTVLLLRILDAVQFHP